MIEKNKLLKREKLLNGESKIKEIKERVRGLTEKNDYNFKLKFFSLFNFDIIILLSFVIYSILIWNKK